MTLAHTWSNRSSEKLKDLCPELRRALDHALFYRDMTIITTYRDEEEQNRMYDLGRSKLRWPKSKHNSLPSDAVDVQPFPYNGDSLREDLSYIAGLIIAFGAADGVEIRWGGDWDQDGETADNKFDDLFHFEVVRHARPIVHR